LARRGASARFTYGLKGSSILAALFNALFLLIVLGGLAWEAIRRFSEPEVVDGKTVMVIAGIGILVNGFTAMLFARGRHGDINIRGAFLHMMTDALISLGVVIAGGLVLWTGALWIDPAVTLLIVVVIVYGTWQLLKDSVAMALAAVPPNIKPEAVRTYLTSLPGVASLHDLHIWPMSTTETALTCHLVMPGGHPGDAFTASICTELSAHFGIQHTTVQIETDEQVDCALANHAA
jgi:cobalt-zinc-cadmium efflux system protein